MSIIGPSTGGGVSVSKYSAIAYRGTAFKLTGPGFTKIPLDTIISDPSKSIAEGFYTAPVDGFYRVSFQVEANCNPTPMIGIAYVNGVEGARGSRAVPNVAAEMASTGSAIFLLKKGDKVELWAYYGTTEKGELMLVGKSINYLAVNYLGTET